MENPESMVFPPVPRVVYEKTPLQRVTCSLFFPTIMTIRSGEPVEFQSRIRKDYPEVRRSPHFPPPPADVPDELVQLLQRLGDSLGPSYLFETADKARSIKLSDRAIVLEDSSYLRRELFQAELRKVEKDFSKVYKPGRYQRVALRYLNLVDKREVGLGGCEWVRLLRPELLGLISLPVLADKIVQTRNQAELSLKAFLGGEDADCVVRHGLVATDDEGTDPEGLYMIEIGFALDFKKGATTRNAFQAIEAFSTEARHLFRALISDELHTALKPTAV